MRISYNDKPFIGRRTGIGRYLERVLAHWPGGGGVRARGVWRTLSGGVWPRLEPSGSRLTKLDRVPPLKLTPLSEVRVPAPDHATGWLRSTKRQAHAGLTGAAQRLLSPMTDVYFEPDHIPPARVGPLVTTVHDLSPIEFPQSHPPDRVRAWQRRFEARLAWTSRFICVSQATAGALQRCFGVEPARISVIHLGPSWDEPPAGWTAQACRARLGLPERTVVHLGTVQPRKNIGVLLDAIAAMGDDAPQLVLLGGLGWGSGAYWRGLIEHPAAGRVLLAGYVSDAQALAALIGGRGLVCPSHYEGFGLPPLEAMQLGRRAVVSTAPSLVEVVGGAAAQIDPEDIDGWAGALRALMETDSAGEAAAKERAAGFSWARAGERHAEVFAEVAAAP